MADRYWVSTNTLNSFSVAAEEISPNGLFFKPDGTKMYVIGSAGDDVNEYNLSSAWDISTASYLQNFSVAAQEIVPQGLFFKPDGTKMYVIGSAGDDVNEYNLSSAWDISTASYLQNFSVAAQETVPTGLFFKPDGTKMYVIGTAGDNVNEYNLSSAWDISTASYLQNFSVAAQETFPQGLFFKPDGTKMYVIGSIGDDVNEYNLSSAWDISTASYLQNFSVAAQETVPQGLFFKDDGTRMYVIGSDTDFVFAYPLSTAWNISTISFDTWDGTAGSKWAATSGGAGGETVPTTADDVFFDGSSTGTVTIAAGNTGAKSITCTGFTGTLMGTAAITLAGSVTLVAGMTYTHTGTMTFTGTGTLTSAGKTFSAVTVDAIGITLTLGDALNTGTRSVTILRGTFDTANYTVTAWALLSSGTNTRAITLGSSTLTLTSTIAIDFTTSTNLTFNAGTSLINCSAVTTRVLGGGQTFYNVSFTSTVTGTRGIEGANTFNNLTLNASGTGLSRLSIFANQTVSGTFTCAGSSAIARGFVLSETIGTTRTITAAVISANDCDFRDITIAGAASPISPTRAGDCGGNTNITFSAAKAAYRVGTNTTWAGSSSWALTSGGTGSNDNFPLAQDTVVINEDTTLTGTLALATYNIGTLDCSARTTGITLNHNAGVNRYGSYTLGSGVTVTGTSTQTFSGRGTMDFTSAGKTIEFPITVDAPGGTLRLGDAFNSSNSIELTGGTFNANNYNLTCASFASSNSNTRTITMGSGLWTLSGTATVWNTSSITNLTFNKDTANILLTNSTISSVSFASGPLTFNKLTIGGGAGTGLVNINSTVGSAAGSYAELASTRTAAFNLQLGNSSTAVIGTWSVSGTPDNVVTVNSPTAGTRRTFTLTNVTSGIDYLAVQDIGELSGSKFYVGSNSTDGGNNNNVIFSDPPIPGTATGNMLMLFY
jgi:sugar lactone lactonase YvrE